MDVALSLRKIFKITKSSRKWAIFVQSQFLLRLAELLQEGFSLSEALKFLQVMMGKQKEDIQEMLKQMERGTAFPSTLEQLGFSSQILVQLHLSIIHGTFNETLAFCAGYIETKHKQWQQFKKVAAYPCFMLVLTLLMLFAVRRFLLPTLQYSVTSASRTTEVLIFVLTYLPFILLGSIFLVSSIVFMIMNKLKKKTAYERAIYYCGFPLVGNWVRAYYTFFFSREFAYFILNGQSIHQMIEQMKGEYTSDLMKELAEKAELSLRKGDSFPQFVKECHLFYQEMSWIIYHGELTSQLGLKLKVYSKECYRQLIADIEKKLNLIQPVLFLLIGLLIVIIYLILMLPMLDMMRGAF
ncbi:competence type IV pilus assembly protein ComGB [Jeotgalibaca caeni]|uniref:competence type IV pilus assembly protein ComGB n=1 Tax=Jeotgalibaca caeni TaxID=3028623 RepID=UPI00237D79EC|nr:competence type IV pilus assembly protein ComGB [Jeotgalibaca caeni]MDE1547835.1 competence type IV pilus assembly protein ComGB [Jeotgalibaca caeni]